MQAFQITGQKDFMNRLLCGTLFQEFDLKEATITAAVTYHMDGHRNQAYFEDALDEKQGGLQREDGQHTEESVAKRKEYIPFEQVRNVIFQMIKGKRPPVAFHMILHLNRENAEKIEEQQGSSLGQMMISNLVLNIRYAGGVMQVVSAVDYADFTMDKTCEKSWDKMTDALLTREEVSFQY